MSKLMGLDRPLGIAIERGRDNNFDLLRLIAAFSVLFGHSFALSGGPQGLNSIDPVSLILKQYTGFNEAIHELGVDVFFIISGFLVARSFMTHKTVIGFIEARVLRIFPAAILCSLVTVAGLAWLSSVPPSDYFSAPQTLRYLAKNSTLWEVTYRLPGVFESNAFPRAVNGSLWTLPIELRAYISLTLLGVLGLLRFRHVSNLVLAVMVILFLVPEWAAIITRREAEWRLYLFFLFGAAFYVNRKYIPIGILPAIVLLALFAGTAALPKLHALVFVALLSYLILALALARYVPALDPGRIGDFSYGVYLYAFPVQQALLHLLPSLNGWWLTVYASIVTVIFAAISWFLVEQRALKKKGYIAVSWARSRG